MENFNNNEKIKLLDKLKQYIDNLLFVNNESGDMLLAYDFGYTDQRYSKIFNKEFKKGTPKSEISNWLMENYENITECQEV